MTRDANILQSARVIHFTGIKGVGMAPLAVSLKQLGHQVQGSDVEKSFITDEMLASHEIVPMKDFSAENIKGADLLIVTAAHGGLENVEAVAARQANIPVLTHAEAMGMFTQLFERVIAVCGTHGKTTTSAMIAHVMLETGEPMGYMVGSSTFSGHDGGGYTGDSTFVIEADEFAERFLNYKPTTIVCTNIDYDHPDTYKNEQEYVAVFKKFFDLLSKVTGRLIYCQDSPELVALAQEMGGGNHELFHSYGFSEKSDFRMEKVGTVCTIYDRYQKGEKLCHLELHPSMAGDHNLLNATAAFVACYTHGLPQGDIIKHLSTFTGVKRRLEKIYTGAYTLYDDYAHHPTEIDALLDALKMRHPKSKIHVVFQPHTYSRTEQFEEEFIKSLSNAGDVMVMDIYSSREKEEDFSVTSQGLVEKARKNGLSHISYCPSRDEVVGHLAKNVSTSDIVVTVGAGDVYTLHAAIQDSLKSVGINAATKVHTDGPTEQSASRGSHSAHSQLEKALGIGRVRQDLILAPYTTFKVGGPAQYYFEPETEEEIIAAVKAAHQLKIPVTILGGVSNIVIEEGGLDGLVIRNRIMTKEVLEDNNTDVLVRISGGYPMTRLAKETAAEGWEGMEYQFGLPGTLGGAIYMNSKWVANPPLRYASDTLEMARLVSLDGTVSEQPYDYFDFSYGYSILQKTHEIFLSATFRFTRDDPQFLLARTKEVHDYRQRTQPHGIPTSGCFFKNVPGTSVGKMIDELGLKGFKVGGAVVSDVHANFIINDGTATADDVRQIVDIIASRVKEAHDIDLIPEVEFIGKKQV